MVYSDLRCFVVLIVVDAVNTSMIFFTCLIFMHCMPLAAEWAYYIPKTFLCPEIAFATFVAARKAQIVTTVTYVPTYFKFSVHQIFTNFRIHFYHQVLVLFPVFKQEFWLYFIFIQIQFRILYNYGLYCVLRSNVFWNIDTITLGVFSVGM